MRTASFNYCSGSVCMQKYFLKPFILQTLSIMGKKKELLWRSFFSGKIGFLKRGYIDTFK